MRLSGRSGLLRLASYSLLSPTARHGPFPELRSLSLMDNRLIRSPVRWSEVAGLQV